MDMKKILFLVGLIAAPLFAATASQNLVKGLELVKSQKADWFNYEKDLHNAKYDLLRKQHNTMFDEKISRIKQFGTEGNLADYEQNMLSNLVASHKANMKEWHNLYASFREKAKSLYERHTKDLEKLETSVNPTEEPEVEEVDVEEMELE